jgi:hypothetical protein
MKFTLELSTVSNINHQFYPSHCFYLIILCAFRSARHITKCLVQYVDVSYVVFLTSHILQLFNPFPGDPRSDWT